MPNFCEIAQNAAEIIWRFFYFSRWRPFAILDFQKLNISTCGPIWRPNMRHRTKFREDWYGDAYWASEWDRKLKFPTFENPRWRTAAILKNWKIAIPQPRFERFRENLACRRSSTSWASQPLKIWIFQNPRWRRPPSWKIENRPYLRNGLTDLREIWYGDAYRVSEWNRNLKFYHMKYILIVCVWQTEVDCMAFWRICVFSKIRMCKTIMPNA